tara:strand:+ start:67922 stop:68899 length:978 start_codon:yes stop_codon:yes gene_type:complete
LALKTACASPSVTYWVDHYQDSGPGEFVRQTVKQNADGLFEAWSAKLFVQDINKTVFRNKIGVFVKEFEAKRAIEQQVTLLEQDEWVYLDDGCSPILNVRHYIDVVLNESRPLVSIQPSDIDELIGSGYVRAQKVVAGLRCYVVMDPHENIWIKPSCDNGNLEWERAGSAILNKLDAFKRVDGTRGVALEVVINGAKVTVIDVLFLHDTWINMDPCESRHTALVNYIRKHKIGCDFHLPVRVSASGVTNVIFGDVKGAIIEKGNIRFVVSKWCGRVHFCGAWGSKYMAQDDETLENLGEVEGAFLPNISYLTVKSAGKGVDAFMY